MLFPSLNRSAPWICLVLGVGFWALVVDPRIENLMARGYADEGPLRVRHFMGKVGNLIEGLTCIQFIYGSNPPRTQLFFREVWRTTWSLRVLICLSYAGLIACLVRELIRTGPSGLRQVSVKLSTILATGALCIVLALALPIASRSVYIYDDIGTFHLPLRHFVSDCYARGDDPGWCPALFCGFDLHGEGQLGLCHPLHWFEYRFMPFDIALNLELLACFGLTLTGMYLLLKQWRLPIAARMMGAITFSFGGPLLQRYVHLNALGVISHIPWLLLCIDLLCRSTSRRSVLAARGGIALLTGSQLLLGHPQYVFITLIAEGLYLGVLLALGPFRARPLVEYVGAKLVGLMLGCAQLLPSAEAVSNSTRSARDTESVLQQAAQNSLHPLNFLQICSPYGLEGRVIPDRAPALYMWQSTLKTDQRLRVHRIWHEFSTYVGLTPILLSLALMVQACDKRHARRFPARLKWYCLVLAAVGC